MKKDEIKNVVDAHFKNIEKNFRKVLIHFNKEDIHQFREEIKKLRSFFHMLDMEAGGDTHFKITPEMKTVYGYTGIISDLHLLLQTIHSNFEHTTNKERVAFIGKLESEITYWQKNTKDYVDPYQNFHVDEETIFARLPEKLKRRSIKKFAGYLSYEIQTHLTRCNDEKLNSIRKLLEDLLFNWEYLKPFADTLPAGLRKEDEIRSLAYPLLDFRDKCAVYSILDTYYNDSESDDEKLMLADIMQVCKNLKEEIKKSTCARLELIPVNPIVKRAFSL